jgi:hypothetical protein
MRSDIVGDVMTLTIIILLAWLPLSALLALVVGGCIRLGSGEPDPLPAPKPAKSRPQEIFEPASA